MPDTQPTRHWIYFIEAEGHAIKIGMAGDLRKRLASLQCGNHLPLKLRVAFEVPNAREVEGNLHTIFAASRLAGEWFAITPELEQYIGKICEGDRNCLGDWCSTGRVRTPDGYRSFDIFLKDRWGMSEQTLNALMEGVKFKVEGATTRPATLRGG